MFPDPKDVIICRCEDITRSELREAIEKGYTEFEELKRYLRVGMGPCQGRTCIPLVRAELARYLNSKLEDVLIPTTRPPLVNMLFGTIEDGSEG